MVRITTLRYDTVVSERQAQALAYFKVL